MGVSTPTSARSTLWMSVKRISPNVLKSEGELTTTPRIILGSGNWRKNCPCYELLGSIAI